MNHPLFFLMPYSVHRGGVTRKQQTEKASLSPEPRQFKHLRQPHGLDLFPEEECKSSKVPTIDETTF